MLLVMLTGHLSLIRFWNDHPINKHQISMQKEDAKRTLVFRTLELPKGDQNVAKLPPKTTLGQHLRQFILASWFSHARKLSCGSWVKLKAGPFCSLIGW